MKGFITLIKSNPIVAVAIAVVILSLVLLFVGVHMPGNAFIKSVEERKKDFGTIDGLRKTTIQIPSPDPNAPPQSISFAVNQASIESLENVYKIMSQQYATVFENVIKHNRNIHTPMLDGLFPAPQNNALFHEAKTEYLNRLNAMLGAPSPVDKDAVRLNAGPPPDAEFVGEELAKVEARFLAGFFPRKTVSELTVEDRAKLLEQQRQKAMDIIRDNARRISIYAETRRKDADGKFIDEYPFTIGTWADIGELPPIKDIWEGQMAMWIQQDICRAIAMANRPAADNAGASDSVLHSAVKHLKHIRVHEDYVGLRGSAIRQPLGGSSKDGKSTGTPRPRPTTPRPPTAVHPSSLSGGPEGYGNPEALKAIAEDLKLQDPNKRLPEDFASSPTGHVCNVLYDVRLAEVSIVVDARQIPLIFESIGKTNFMSVLNVHIEDVDEYAELEKGYMYGATDCVTLTMLVESIWLRDWTRDLMPKDIKMQLGIPTEPAPATPGAPTAGSPGTPSAAAR